MSLFRSKGTPVVGSSPSPLKSSSSEPPAVHHRHSLVPSPEWRYLYVLPVLLLEFLAIALTRAVLPGLLLDALGDSVYIVMGAADCVRGILAFAASPLFGQLSDRIGRKPCLLVTVIGTCAPICSLAFWGVLPTAGQQSNGDAGIADNIEEPVDTSDATPWWAVMGFGKDSSSGDASSLVVETIPPQALYLFVVLLALSGIFSSTFTLVFCYISDTVQVKADRVSAYGLALATFGLSFTIGPMAGGYLVEQANPQYVFVTSLFFTILDVLYIYYILPESKEASSLQTPENWDMQSVLTMDYEVTITWNPWDTFRTLRQDAFLFQVGKVAFLYYTGLWAIISTLSVYAVRRFHLSSSTLGELMSALGLCTMVAEAVLVRVMVPLLGERRSIRIGLVSFGMQCLVLALAYEPWHLFVCAACSMLGNLVYPSLSSLIAGHVAPEAVGRALGTMNGVKALTEGIGPLVFGTLMTLSEDSALPGWPYLVAALLAVFAYQAAGHELLDAEDVNDENVKAIHELQTKGIYGPKDDRYGEDENEELEGLLLSEIGDSDIEEVESVLDDGEYHA